METVDSQGRKLGAVSQLLRVQSATIDTGNVTLLSSPPLLPLPCPL